MHESVHSGRRHGFVREDLVPRNEKRIGRDGDALALVELSNQLKQHGGLDLGAQVYLTLTGKIRSEQSR